MICLFLADSDLNSLFALPRDQLQEVAQLWVALSPFRSTGRKDFACGFLAFEFPDSHSVLTTATLNFPQSDEDFRPSLAFRDFRSLP
jgi:hypothetical protein